MNIKIEVKIKLDKKGTVTLNSDEAKELYFKLKDIYDNKYSYIPYPNYPWYQPGIVTYTTSSDTYMLDTTLGKNL